MKPSKISTDDPRLTAYALGELEPHESAQVEEALRHNAAAREAVNEIRALARDLERSLENEPIEPRVAAPSVLASVSDAAAENDSESEDAPEAQAPLSGRGQLLRFPSIWLTTAAAASVAAVLALHSMSERGKASATYAVASANASVPASTQVGGETVAADKAPSSLQSPDKLNSAALADEDARRRSMRDGFSDVKPATFREDGLKLGKSVASAGASEKSAQGKSADDTVEAVNRTPITEPDTIRFESPEKALAASNEVHASLPALTLNGDLPVLEIHRSAQVPLIQFNPDFAFASKDFKFSNSIVGSGVLKLTPRKTGTTYEQVLTWSHDGAENQSRTPRRDDAIDPLKKTKHSATGAVVE